MAVFIVLTVWITFAADGHTLLKTGYDKSFKAAVKEFIKDMNSDSMPVAVRDQNGNIVGATKLYKKMVNKK